MRTKDLIQFCEVIGIPLEKIKEAEGPRKYNIRETVPADKLKRLSKDDFDKLVKSFGKSLSIRIGDRV